jgi:hypothetical protein
LPSFFQEASTVRREVGLREHVSFQEFGIERFVGAVQAGAGVQDPSQERAARFLQVHQVDGPPTDLRQGLDASFFSIADNERLAMTARSRSLAKPARPSPAEPKSMPSWITG